MFGPEQNVLIVTGIITFIGLFVPIFFLPLANFIFTKPFVIFEYFEDDENDTLKNITIQNFGQGPAHNITLLLESSEGKISNLFNEFSTSELLYNNKTIDINQILPINRTILELEIPVLIQGIGSQVKVQLELETNSSKLTRGNAIFSEGSVLMEKNNGNSLLTFLNFWYHNYLVIIGAILFVIIASGLIIAGKMHHDRNITEKTIRKAITTLIDDMAKNRNFVILNPLCRIPNVNKPNTDDLMNKGLITAVEYGLINNFYSNIEKRDLLLSFAPINRAEVTQLNILIEAIVDKIFDRDWRRFTK